MKPVKASGTSVLETQLNEFIEVSTRFYSMTEKILFFSISGRLGFHAERLPEENRGSGNCRIISFISLKEQSTLREEREID